MSRVIAHIDMNCFYASVEEKYVPGLTKEECLLNVTSVLKKREVQNAVITGIEMDVISFLLLIYPFQYL